jgi:hypothetical protein
MHRFEDLAQQLIETSLARLLREHLQSRDVLQSLVRAIDDAQSALQVRDTPPPNHFWVSINSADLARLRESEPRLADELAEQVRQIMLQMGLRLDRPPRVLLNGSDDVPTHQLRISARWIPTANAQTTAQSTTLARRPFLIVDGRRQVDLNHSPVTIGRSRAGDIVLDDRRVSRHHLELRWVDASERFLAVDMGSSGGTRLNGQAIKQCPLEAGDVLSLGGYELIYGEEFELSSTSAFIKPESGSTRTDGNAADAP